MKRIRYNKDRDQNTELLFEDCDDEMIDIPMRNYLCRNYDNCLNNAARANKVFGCESCKRFELADKRELSTAELGGMLSLWESVFEAPISIH
ncbi:MAG: hypothetical protein BWK80_16000 [Desulfobacteraceae bacterium IS3]|jgi:hypothetical protein|nr:MAG: hypothetical protein BWK80_16000 [Desulfobacteraceae bacterium IS3]